MLTATHTHSGPGGCFRDGSIWDAVTPGSQPAHLQVVISSVVAPILEARQTAVATELGLVQGAFADDLPVAWSSVKRKRLDNIERYSAEDQLYYHRRYAAQGPKRTYWK